MDYSHIITLKASQATFTRNITDLVALPSAQGDVWLYGATHIGGGIGAFSLVSADEPVRYLSGAAYSQSTTYLGKPRVELLTIAGNPVVAGIGVLSTDGFSHSPDRIGRLGSLAQALGQGEAQGIAGFMAQNNSLIELGQFSAGGRDYLYSVANNQLGYDIWQLQPDGRITMVMQVGLPFSGAPEHAEIDKLIVMTVGAKQFLIGASALANSLTLQEIGADGTFGPVRTLSAETGIGLNQPTQLEAVTVAGVSYLVVGSARSSSLTTMRVTSGGELLPIDHILDERSTRFDGVTAMTSLMVDGRVFVFVGGRDSGISVFTMLPGGSLLHLLTLADQDGWSMANVSAIAAAQIGGKIALFVTSTTEEGVTQLSLDPGKIGLTAVVGAGSQSGGAFNDMLTAGAETTALSGGAGDDILVGNGGILRLTGGAGRDTFVVAALTGRTTITDFEYGVDRLDLSNLGMIRSTMQLAMSSQPWGMRIRIGDAYIDIRSHDGRPMELWQFTNDMFPHAHYAPPSVGNTVYGSAWDDTLMVGSLVSRLFGRGGNDVLIGAAGDDHLDGGEGNDTLTGGGGNDKLYGGEGNDLVRGNDGHDQIWAGDSNDSLYGGSGRDSLWGEAGNDLLSGEDEDDMLFGGTGDDTLYGDQGNDYLDGGAGNDQLFGGEGDDRLTAFAGNNLMNGGLGNDSLTGGSGADSLYGGEGRDTLRGGDDNDRLYGENDNDILFGDLGNDTLYGQAGNDRLYGGTGNDLLSGGLGDDFLFGEGGNDLFYGGPGNDWINGQADSDTLYGEDGNDVLFGGAGNDKLYGQNGNDTLQGDDGNDLLYGSEGNDLLFGNAGNDTLYSGTGNDRLFGGTGNDTLDGGEGNDLLYGNLDLDLLRGGAGNDTLWGGDGNSKLYGDAGNDRLNGGSGADLLDGGTGNDVLSGGFGHDSLLGGTGNDTLFGGAGMDLLRGGAGADSLNGGTGNDRLHGGAGADILRGGTGNDVFLFNERADFDRSTDIVADFVRGQDRLDLRGLGLGFIGKAAFSGAPQIRAEQQGTTTTLLIDLDGNRSIDLTIKLQGVWGFGASDLLL